MTLAQTVLYFSLYSFLGWCMETIFATIKNKHFTNRGFLFGPFCPMYGFAAVIIITLSKSTNNNIFGLYFICFFGASFIEYITGYILEELFNAKWWDYSKMFLNIKGRVCLLYSIIWGFFGLIIIKLLQPIGSKLITEGVNFKFAQFLSNVLIVYFIIDLTITLINLFQLKYMLSEIERMSIEAKNYLINLRIIAKEKVSFPEGFSRDFWNKNEVIDNIPKEMKERYDNIIEKIANSYYRIFEAFPQLNSQKLNKAFADIRKKIKSKVR